MFQIVLVFGKYYGKDNLVVTLFCLEKLLKINFFGYKKSDKNPNSWPAFDALFFTIIHIINYRLPPLNKGVMACHWMA